jgi:hypothetical protein
MEEKDNRYEISLQLKLLMIVIPIACAVGAPFYADGEYSWVLKSLIGLLFGSFVSLLGLRDKFVPPYSNIIAAFAAFLLFAAIVTLAISSPVASFGTVVTGAIISLIVFWALKQ